MCYDNNFLYLSSPPSNKKIGLKLEKNSASILFENGVEPLALFYLTEILIRNLAVFQGMTFMHSSGVILDDTACVFPAWGGTGKSNLLIQFLERGAKYLGDDLVILNENGYILPYPKPLNLLCYNFNAYPKKLLEIAALKTRCAYKLFKIFNVLSNTFAMSSSLFSKLLAYLKLRYEYRTHEYIRAERLFGADILADLVPIKKHKIFFMIRTPGRDIQLEEISGDFLAKKMSHCLRWERNYLVDSTGAYLYAFPEKEELIKDILRAETQNAEACFSYSQSVNFVKVGMEVAPPELFEFFSEKCK
jgi:hypothetical protein